MSDSNPDGLGELIQAYVRSRWGGVPLPEGEAPPGELLDQALRDRVDVLGFDSDELLSVPAHEVLATLERLENEAAREDARIAVATIHARVARPPGVVAGAPAKSRRKGASAAPRREQRARPRRKQPAGNGGRSGAGSRTRGRR